MSLRNTALFVFEIICWVVLFTFGNGLLLADYPPSEPQFDVSIAVDNQYSEDPYNDVWLDNGPGNPLADVHASATSPSPDPVYFYWYVPKVYYAANVDPLV